jgi:DNA-binding MarR family transcriptional regulator
MRIMMDVSSGTPVRHSPAALARRFARICNAIMAESLEGEDLAPLHYGVLSHLTGESDMDQIGLAARLGIDRTNIGVIVAQLESRGLVARRVDGNDRRARLVRITPAGARLYARLSRLAPARQQRMLAPLTGQERKLFLDFLVRIVRANEAYARPGAGRRKRRISQP